ncbi:hypothetical protein, partial [Vibrio cholerae]|uniref:hypothetical protein n=1 Tax=Vibrio cholerae TaxID=666 RepID=UPI00301C700A
MREKMLFPELFIVLRKIKSENMNFGNPAKRLRSPCGGIQSDFVPAWRDMTHEFMTSFHHKSGQLPSVHA